MEAFLEYLKVLLLGILEGVTEWLPISSTGHLLLLDEVLRLKESDGFKEVFFVVIQLGAVLAVFFHFGKKMLPLTRTEKKLRLLPNTVALWLKVVLACVPGAICTLLLDDALERFLNHTVIFGSLPLMPLVIALALILYGVIFILTERKGKAPRITQIKDLRYKDALLIGLFQVLSIIPGTSRSGSTILGAIMLGVGRGAGAEFSFFMAIPTMLGASAIKGLKFVLSGVGITGMEIAVLVVGCVVSFIVSLLVIKALMDYVRRHSFSAFGVYRIVLGVIVLAYFLIF